MDMPKTAKDVANASQKQKYVFSLPSDVLAEVLRYFSRKELCQQIYAVNRQFFHVAISRQQVPTIHVISQIQFYRSERRALLHRSLVQIGNDSTIRSRQFKAMSPPGPFIRFRKVLISRFLGEKTLRFLRQTKESFIGSVIEFRFTHICDDKKMISQMNYLLQNIFNNPSSWFTMSGRCLQFSEFAFESNNSLLSDFVITFVECSEEMYCCLKGDHEFSLDKISTGERLSVFRHLEYGPGSITDRAYRLWYRKVTSDAEDSTMLSYLLNFVNPDSDFKDLEFYDFSYPLYWHGC
ncbi:hypothetical protein Ddc_16891 [Ditylenchus destructor]|nr:hypothetical protein Ddc_16891 [Ditylenchus destructor]